MIRKIIREQIAGDVSTLRMAVRARRDSLDNNARRGGAGQRRIRSAAVDPSTVGRGGEKRANVKIALPSVATRRGHRV